MSFVSYAQNFEDVMLWRALKNIVNGIYIDVGAAWPDEHSVTKSFYDKGWHGINIEPNPAFYQRLIQDRPRDINLQVAVSDSQGTLPLYLIPNTGLSTLDKSIVNQHIQSGWQATSHEVGVTTLKSICELHISNSQEVHFLKIDVEGLEEAVLRSNDWTFCRPWIVLVEATLPMSNTESYSAWESILLNAEYTFAYADGLNRFYVSKEHLDLMDSLRYPPNVFDSFIQISQLQAEAKAQQAEAKAQQAEAKAQHAEAKAQHAEAKAQQAEAKAQHAEAKAQQAEAKAQQTEAKAQQTEAKAQQTEAKAQQTDVKAREAEVASNQHLMQLHAVYNSTSWRITAPLRWPMHQRRLLRAHGIKQRIKAFSNRLLRTVLPFVMARPKLKLFLTTLAHRTGVAKGLKLFFQNSPTTPIGLQQECHPTQNTLAEPMPADLSPRARQIYKDLKQAIEIKQKEQA